MAQGPSNPKIEELRFRLKADPKSRLFYPLAEELRKISQFAEAEQVLRTGLTHHPTYLSAWVSSGRVLRELGRNGEAVDALSKALQLDPGNVVAARLLADAYLSLGEKVEAIKKYKLVHALLPSDEQIVETIARLDAELNPPAPIPPPFPPPLPVEASAAPEAESLPFAAEPEPGALPLAVEPESEPLPFAEVPQAAAVSAPFMAEAEPELWMPAPPASAEGEPEPEPAPLPVGAPSLDESPFASDDVAILEAAEHTFVEEQEEAAATADAEPMLAAHAESPFEEPAPESTPEAIAIEEPSGIHVEEAPLAAEVAAPAAAPAAWPVAVDEEPVAGLYTPTVETPFPPDEAEAAMPAEDLAENVVMADLYERQGLAEKAREIYEHILQREPQNTLVRARLDAIAVPAAADDASQRNPKVTKLEEWLSKVGRKEVSRV
jgi:tetratricopeptide (TPR) repeat protein